MQIKAEKSENSNTFLAKKEILQNLIFLMFDDF
jgi:hypothetical protein